MAEHIVVGTVIVHRDGKNFAPKIGEPFEFTASEVKDIQTLSPDAIREPINESRTTAKTAGKADGGKAVSTNKDDM